MGKRTKRIAAHQIAGVLQDLSGQIVHVVMWNGETRVGTITSTSDNEVVLTDSNSMWYNRKKHAHHIHISDIREILIDQVSPW